MMKKAKNVPYSPRYKRTRYQRQLDLAYETKLYLEGWTQNDIALHMGEVRDYTLSQQAIANDLKSVWQEWRKEYIKNADEIKTKELARIDKIENELWQAWRRSQEKEEEIISEREDVTPTGVTQRKPNTPDAAMVRSRVRRKEKNRDGSMTFMEGIMWCVEQRAKILGLNAPEKHEIDWRVEAEKAGVNPDELHSDLVNQFVKAAQQGINKNAQTDD